MQDGGAVPTCTPVPKNVGIFANRYFVRRLTPLECERLMGFPDEFTVAAGSDNARYRCLGNAVIPHVIEQVGRRLLP